MSKMKIEIRKPQYLAAKESGVEVKEKTSRKRMPIFFRLLLVATYMLSGLAIWYVYQKHITPS
ncbi:MAG: hypothetical protein WC484_03270 [Candidatus Omnitrophota bacterium]